MSSWQFRRWSRVVALVLLAATVRLPHAAADDDACAPWLLIQSADGGMAVAQDSGAAATPDHCAICHWTRLLRSPLTPLGVLFAAAGAATTLERGPQHVYVVPVQDHLPARAPPAELL
jgi:hypothetical protein